jgi:hypothetical protein
MHLPVYVAVLDCLAILIPLFVVVAALVPWRTGPDLGRSKVHLGASRAYKPVLLIRCKQARTKRNSLAGW